MAKMVFRYIYDDLRDSENSCILSTIKQVSDITGMSYSTLQNILSKRDIYYDKSGRFKVERRMHYMAEKKSRV